MKAPTNPTIVALNSKEYHVVEKDGKRYYEHRLKAGLGRKKRGGRKSKVVVDHVNNSKKSNSKGNLKVMTRGQNVAKSNRTR